jgi:hypothetical protein
MNKSLRKGLLLALLVLVFLLARFPATLAAHALPPSVSLAGLEGSIWSGRASALGFNGVVAQEKLVWHFAPAELLKGRLVWSLSCEHAGQPGSLRTVLGMRGAALEQLHIAVPLEPLTQFNPTLSGIRLRGTLILDSERLARAADLRLTGRAERVSSAMANEVTALGNYQFTVTMDPTGAGAIEVSPQGGALQISGGGAFNLTKEKFNINLRLKPETDLPGLSPVLATLPREQDSYLLNYVR